MTITLERDIHASQCNTCDATEDVMALRFRPPNYNGSTVIAICPTCRALLVSVAALPASQPVALTVGAALADPRVQDGSHATESELLCGHRQYLIADRQLRTRLRSMDDGAAWGRWRATWISMDEIALPATLVPLSDADIDPSARGAMP